MVHKRRQLQKIHGSVVAGFMNSRHDPTQLQWRSLINCINIDNDETNVIVLFVIILMKVRSLTMTLQKISVHE
jgi:hypothetical protein